MNIFIDKTKLEEYANLVIKVGVNLQPEQELVINADVSDCEFARIIAKVAYQNKAKKVTIMWRDELFTKLRYENENLEMLVNIPQYQIEERNYSVDKKAAYLCILSEDPNLMKGIDPKILAETSKAKNIAFQKFYDASMKNEIRWNLIAVPSVSWAKTIFPELNDTDAVNNLWNLIFKTMRLDKENPVEEWQNHISQLRTRSEFLNKANLKELHYKNSLGTDLIIGLPENYLFEGCGEKAMDGVPFVANMPTEEIFSAPHRLKVDGKVVASMPLIYNGTKIENFGFTFEKGRIVDFFAESGYEVLKNLIETDEGSHYLGEVALVQFNSPIRNLNTLFYNTLFDENASCHLAIGEAYPSCLKDGSAKSKTELFELGLNDSLEHVDFMIGTNDLQIDGITKDENKISIFKDGNFVF
jgi:aminopeptidase